MNSDLRNPAVCELPIVPGPVSELALWQVSLPCEMLRLVRVRGHVYCGDAAQRRSSLAEDRGVGAWAGYQADRKPHFRKRLLRAHRAERVGRSKDYFEVGASRFQTTKEFGCVGRYRIAGAFHHQGIGRQREAVIERIEKDVDDSLPTHRICGGKAKINRSEERRCPEIQISCNLPNR